MADRTFKLDIVTPDRTLFSGEVAGVVAPGQEGSFGVLANHAPLIAALGLGELRVKATDGRERSMALTGGFFEIAQNHAIVLADGGEWSEEIDVARAEKSLSRAQERLTSGIATGTDAPRATRAAARAKLRLKIAKGTGDRRPN